MRSAALAYGLDFVPLAEERFDLVIPRELLQDARVTRLLEALTSGSFRREMESLGCWPRAAARNTRSLHRRTA
jgi:molybdate-binding protein